MISLVLEMSDLEVLCHCYLKNYVFDFSNITYFWVDISQ